jgi:hypothetical protein
MTEARFVGQSQEVVAKSTKDDEAASCEQNDQTPVSVRALHMQSHLDDGGGSPVPWQQFIKSIDRMSVDHALEHTAQVE